MAIVQYLLIAVVAGTFVGSFVFDAEITGRLRDKHRGVWDELGQPGVLAASSVASTLRLRKYLRRRSHLSLDDPELSQAVLRKRWSERIYLTGLAVYLATVYMQSG